MIMASGASMVPYGYIRYECENVNYVAIDDPHRSI